MAKKKSKQKAPEKQPVVKNQTVAEQNILLLQDKKEGTVSAIRRNQEGKPEKEPLTPDVLKSIQRFDPNSDFFSSFLKQLLTQMQQPDRFFYSIPEKLMSTVLKPLDKMVKIEFPPELERKCLIDPQTINPGQAQQESPIQEQPQPEKAQQTAPVQENQNAPQTETNPEQAQGENEQQTAHVQENQTASQPEAKPEQAQGETKAENRRYPIDDNKIPWQEYENRWNIKKEFLDKDSYEDIIRGRRTRAAFPVRATAKSGEEINVYAKLELRYGKNDELNLYIHGIKPTPNLEREFNGHAFSEEDKKRLLSADGSMGRAVDLKFPKQNEPMRCLISRDRITNDLLFMPVKYINIPNLLKGVTLSDAQKQMLKEGQSIESQNFVSKNKQIFPAKVFYDVETKSLRFKYQHNLKVGNTICGAKLTDKQQEDINAGKEIYVEGMKRKGSDEPFNRYIRADFDNNKLKFSDKPFSSAVEIEAKQNVTEKPENKPTGNRQQKNKPAKGITVH